MNKISTYRKQLGLSQRQLAVQLGWIQSRLANYEANFRTPGLKARCARSESLATAITIPKPLCWRITGWRGRAEQRQNHTICRRRLPVAHATI